MTLLQELRAAVAGPAPGRDPLSILSNRHVAFLKFDPDRGGLTSDVLTGCLTLTSARDLIDGLKAEGYEVIRCAS